MAITNLANGTVSIGGVAVSHLLTSYKASKEIVLRENLNAANTPYPDYDVVKETVKGSLGFTLDAAVDYVDTGTDKALIVTGATGLYFSGNVNITNVAVEFDVEAESKATISFDFESIDGDFVYNKAAA